MVEIDLAAVGDNVDAIARHVRTPLCAVVKADAYGHGAVPVASAALEAGATWLAVAHASEGAALRAAGIEAPILLLSEPLAAEVPVVLAAGLRAAVYSPEGIDRLAAARPEAPVKVHLKIDTGMHRVGAAPEHAVALARRVLDRPGLELEAVWTHCAVADEPTSTFTDRQLDCFDAVCAALDAAGVPVPLRHAANSAAALAHPRSRLDLVRVGIALYGIPPAPALASLVALRPVMRWRSEVTQVKVVAGGEAVSYGLRHTFATDTVVATVPVGYADGVPRRWGLAGGRVLLGGRERPIVGVVTMDQLMVDCGSPSGGHGGAAPTVAVGDEVVLLGRQGRAEITAGEIAAALDTIAYEIVTGVGPRVGRHYGRAVGPTRRELGGGGTRRPG